MTAKQKRNATQESSRIANTRIILPRGTKIRRVEEENYDISRERNVLQKKKKKNIIFILTSSCGLHSAGYRSHR